MDGEQHGTRRPISPGAEEILGQYFPVLDHGFVALVDYMGSDEDIERAARVSYGHGTRKRSETRGLIRYLRRHLAELGAVPGDKLRARRYDKYRQMGAFVESGGREG